MLFLAGELDREPGQATAARFEVDLDKPMDFEKNPIRTVYLPVARNNAVAEMALFDAANPDLVDGKRSQTTVPTQALYLLNSEFVQTALHEIGHAVGLDHVNDPSQIMNPFVVDGVDQLADGDIAGLQYLYGASTVGETTITGTGAGEVINRSAETFNLEIFGLAGDDTITGGTGNDKLSGGLGNDRLNGNAGADVLADGFGDNQLYGAAGPDKLVVFSGSNTLHGDAGNDIILGGIGRDSLNGGDGNDTLIGDVLVGSVFNDDTLDGGAGDDLLSGGGGADVFVFRSNGGHDTIANIRLDSFNANPTVGGRDFQPGIDKIDITGLGMAPGSSPLAAVTDVGGNATFAAGGISIEIVGVAKADLSDSDFIWA